MFYHCLICFTMCLLRFTMCLICFTMCLICLTMCLISGQLCLIIIVTRTDRGTGCRDREIGSCAGRRQTV